MNTKITISDDVRLEIMNKKIEPSIKKDIDELLSNRKCMRITGQTLEISAKILIAGSSVLSFASGYFDDIWLAFLAGGLSTLSLSFIQLSNYVQNQSLNNSKELNKILEKIDVQTLPIINTIQNIHSPQTYQQNRYSTTYDLPSYQPGRHLVSPLPVISPSIVYLNEKKEKEENEENKENKNKEKEEKEVI
jgi:hypothetical protein